MQNVVMHAITLVHVAVQFHANLKKTERAAEVKEIAA